MNQTLYKDPGFDALRDFTPVALIAVSPNILVAHPSEPAADRDKPEVAGVAQLLARDLAQLRDQVEAMQDARGGHPTLQV